MLLFYKVDNTGFTEPTRIFAMEDVFIYGEFY